MTAASSQHIDIEPGPVTRLDAPVCAVEGSLEDASLGLRAFRALLAAQDTLVRRLDHEVLAGGVLGVEDVDVLLPLAQEPTRQMRMSELAKRSLISRSGLTRRLDRLEARGLAQRRSCPSDRRGANAAITERGLAELERALPLHRDVIERHLDERLTDDQQMALTAILERLGSEAPTKLTPA
jgi:DNA-binding MarR family transcriptional regulator